MEPPAAQIQATTAEPILEARLVHAEAGRRVVEVSAWRSGSCLGRSLGEGADAEAAEERAILRLRQRLEAAAPPLQPAAAVAPPQRRPVPPPTPGVGAAATQREGNGPVPSAAGPQERADTVAAAAPSPAGRGPHGPAPTLPPASGQPPGQAVPPEEPAPDPEDWSEELAELDVQLQRLGWDRAQESTYLQRAFGHPSRSRLTAFTDLVAYLRALRSLGNGSRAESAAVPLRRRDLLSQSEQLLGRLGWDAARGRALLEETFRLSSRQQLSDEQLLQFNMLLESELMRVDSAPAAAGSPG
ncbi:MAG: hypothetical protein RLZZ219_1578 [Cyanobacteriota bacterium]